MRPNYFHHLMFYYLFRLGFRFWSNYDLVSVLRYYYLLIRNAVNFFTRFFYYFNRDIRNLFFSLGWSFFWFLVIRFILFITLIFWFNWWICILALRTKWIGKIFRILLTQRLGIRSLWICSLFLFLFLNYNKLSTLIDFEEWEFIIFVNILSFLALLFIWRSNFFWDLYPLWLWNLLLTWYWFQDHFLSLLFRDCIVPNYFT